MAERHHHRTKSQLARSLLSRVSSRGEGRKDEDSEAGEQSGRPSFGSESNLSVTSTNRSTRHRPHLNVTMSNVSPSNIPESSTRGPPSMDSSPVTDTGASLEQSVRLFRYFEALRNGDTAAIAKALKEQAGASPVKLQGTSILHLAIQCADMSVIEFIGSSLSSGGRLEGLNGKDKEGNTPLHMAAKLGRAPVVSYLLDQDDIDDSITNLKGETALDVAYSPEIFQQLQLARSLFIDSTARKVHSLVGGRDYTQLEKMLQDPKIRNTIDVNSPELATDKATLDTGGTLLHEAARKQDVKLAQLLLMNGADPFKRDRKGKLPQDVTKDDRTRHILKRSPAAEAAKRSLQEKSILGSTTALPGPSSTTGEGPMGSKESREMKGYLKKWTNYTGGWKLRWFVLEEGVLSYYKHQGVYRLVSSPKNSNHCDR